MSRRRDRATPTITAPSTWPRSASGRLTTHRSPRPTARAAGRDVVTENVADFCAERDVALVFVLKTNPPSGAGRPPRLPRSSTSGRTTTPIPTSVRTGHRRSGGETRSPRRGGTLTGSGRPTAKIPSSVGLALANAVSGAVAVRARPGLRLRPSRSLLQDGHRRVSGRDRRFP